MPGQNFKFFQNTQCEYFPCHKTDSNNALEDFNCLFCYCPLYALKDKCGGDFVYNEKGIKVCTGCTKPHSKDGYEHIKSHTEDIKDLGRL